MNIFLKDTLRKTLISALTQIIVLLTQQIAARSAQPNTTNQALAPISTEIEEAQAVADAEADSSVQVETPCETCPVNEQGAAATEPTADPTAVSTVEGMGFTTDDWEIYRETVADIESDGVYDIAGGSNGHYDGRYQMGRVAKTDAARILGEEDPGHGAAARQTFRQDPAMQERYFAAFTRANHNYLMRNPAYQNASNERKLQILGYAHNQGMGGANTWLNTGEVGTDGFGTHGTAYSDGIADAFRSRSASENQSLSIEVNNRDSIPKFKQTNSSDTNLYISQEWAETTINYGGEKPRYMITCLSTVYAMIEHWRGNTAYRIGGEGTWDYKDGAIKLAIEDKRIDNPEISKIRSEFVDGNPIVFKGMRNNAASHFILGVGIDENNIISALDPASGTEIRFDGNEMKFQSSGKTYNVKQIITFDVK